MATINYSEKTFVVCTHVFATGPGQDLKEYLISKKAKKVFFIGHPLIYDKRLKDSGHEYYEEGKLKNEVYQELRSRSITFLHYIFHVLKTVFWVLRTENKWDLFVGCANPNAFAGVILKLLGKVDKTVYYMIDYNPKRFRNRLLNGVYHFIDRFCVKYSDETWNLSFRMIEGRKKYFGFEGGNQKVLPIGLWSNRIKRVPLEEVEKHTVVFVGHLLKKQGVQHVVSAIPGLMKKFPDFKLVVIGTGNYLKELKAQVSKLGVGKYVKFEGYVKDPREVEKMISKGSVGVALYDKYDGSGNLTFTYFADPGKIKLYLACGVHVLTTNVAYNVGELKEEGLCTVVKDFEKDITRLFLNNWEERLKAIREDSKKYVQKYNWEVLFKKAIDEVCR